MLLNQRDRVVTHNPKKGGFMRTFSIRQICLLVASIIGIAALTGCSTPNPVYRTYYQDSHCGIFYVDGSGNRVYEWKTSSSWRDFVAGHTMCRDANGRLYFEDSFGNRFYQHRMCE